MVITEPSHAAIKSADDIPSCAWGRSVPVSMKAYRPPMAHAEPIRYEMDVRTPVRIVAFLAVDCGWWVIWKRKPMHWAAFAQRPTMKNVNAAIRNGLTVVTCGLHDG